MYRFFSKFAIALIALISACGDNGSNPVIPTIEITCKVSGYLALDYSSSGFSTYTTGNNKHIINAAGIMYGDTTYKVLFAITYPTSELKTGIFPIVPNPFDFGTTAVYAQFTIERKDSTIVFPADSGYVDIKEIDKRTLKGSFRFYATEKNSKRKVVLENGMLDIFNF